MFSVSAAYIKVYLLENGICVAKKKTKAVRKSLDPLYNQVLVFSESPQGKVVQVRHFQEWNSPNTNLIDLAIWSFCIRELLFTFWTRHLLNVSSSSSVYHPLAAVACTDILRRWCSSGKKEHLVRRVKPQTVRFIKGILYYRAIHMQFCCDCICIYYNIVLE